MKAKISFYNKPTRTLDVVRVTPNSDMTVCVLYRVGDKTMIIAAKSVEF